MKKPSKPPPVAEMNFPKLTSNPEPPPPRAWKPQSAYIPPGNLFSSILDLITILNNPALKNILSLLTNFLQKLANSPASLASITNLLSAANNFLN